MSSQVSNTSSQLTHDQKVKAMALRYRKYIAKHKTPHTSKSKGDRVKQWATSFHASIGSCWRFIVPRAIKGPSTPYEILQDALSMNEKELLANISLSKMSISQSVQKGSLTVLLTLTEESVGQSLLKLNNHQQFNLLIRNKGQIIPVFPKKNPYKSPLLHKLNDLLLGRAPEYEYTNQQYILVCWKGLFDEILIIELLTLDDENLSSKVLRACDNREEYENGVRRLAVGEGGVENCSQLGMMEKSTNITKSSASL